MRFDVVNICNMNENKNNSSKTTSNTKHQTSNSSSGAKVVSLKKLHPCGSSEFTVIRESVIVTLKCNTCGSFVRMERERYEKSLKNPPTERGETQ